MTALTKVVPARRITVLPEGQSSKFQSTLPATRSADIKPGGLAATVRQSRKLLKLSGRSAMSLRISAMAACKSSRLAPLTRTASP